MREQHKHHHIICPWWLGYWLLFPLRKFWHNPSVFRQYLKEGMTVLEIGSGMGYFTLPFARMVGKSGKVIALDIQDRMLSKLRQRATRSGLAGRIETRKIPMDTIAAGDLAGTVDVVAALFVVHEMPDPAKAFAEFYAALKKGGLLIFAEPPKVVPPKEFEESVALATGAGFIVQGELPGFRSSRSKILRK